MQIIIIVCVLHFCWRNSSHVFCTSLQVARIVYNRYCTLLCSFTEDFHCQFSEYAPNRTQRIPYSKTLITSVFSVLLSGTQTPSTEFVSEYEKEFYHLGASFEIFKVSLAALTSLLIIEIQWNGLLRAKIKIKILSGTQTPCTE